MAHTPVDNFLDSENIIAKALKDANIVAAKHIFRAPDADELVNMELEGPALLITNTGFTASPELRGSANSQKFSQFWTITMVCNKAIYLTEGGIAMVKTIQTLKGLKHAQWPSKMRVGSDRFDTNKPGIQGDLVLFPMTFTLEFTL